jgi:glutathione peroxidase-family protein
MTVKERLIKEGYTFQPECGCWVNDDEKGFLHSYLQDPESVGDDDIWNFEKVDQDGNLVEQHLFTEYSFINY